MLDTAAELALDALGYGFRALGYVERDSAAAASLLARVANSTLHRAPVFGDCLSRVDARPLRGWVDLLIASPPCQPYSSAGKRLGNADERSCGDGDGPLVQLARIVDESRPAVGWFENVGEWFTDGHFREFGERLCDLGYECAPPLFVASEDIGGAPHARERVFVMVYAECAVAWARELCAEARNARFGNGRGSPGRAVGDADGLHEGRWPDAERGAERGNATAGTGGEVAHGDSGRRERNGRKRRGQGAGVPCDARRVRPELAEPEGGGLEAVRESSGRGGQPDRGDVGMADAKGPRLQGGEPARRGSADGRSRKLAPAPVPPGRPIFDDELAAYARRDRTTLDDVRGRVAGSAGALRQWAALAAGGLDPTLMPTVEPGVSVVADAMAPPSSDLLRIGGNGVDPLVAAHAFRTLWLEAFGG